MPTITGVRVKRDRRSSRERWRARHGLGPVDIGAASAQQRQRTAHQESLRRAAGGGRALSPDEADLQDKARPYIRAYESAYKAKQYEALPKIMEQVTAAGLGNVPYFQSRRIQAGAGGVPEEELSWREKEQERFKIWTQKKERVFEDRIKIDRALREGKAQDARKLIKEHMPISEGLAFLSPDDPELVRRIEADMAMQHYLPQYKQLFEAMQKPGAATEAIWPQFREIEKALVRRGSVLRKEVQTIADKQAQAEAKVESRQRVAVEIGFVNDMLDRLLVTGATDKEGNAIIKYSDPAMAERLKAEQERLLGTFLGEQTKPAVQAAPISELPATLPGVGVELNKVYSKATPTDQELIAKLLDDGETEENIIKAWNKKIKK